jgi:ABC-2 type transport system permease protein
MKLVLAHARMQIAELVRLPSFSIATVGFPALFFLLFGLPRAHGRENVLLASFAAFAVLGVGFYQFGVSTAIERSTPWYVWMRTLPCPARARIGGRVISALVFAAAAATLVVAVALATTPASLHASEWLRLTAALLIGAVPFVLLGLAIAYWASPKGALPIANVFYLLLAYAGGLWTGPSELPHAVQTLSPYTPTRQWGDVLWAAATGGGWEAAHWLALAGYAVGFGLVAAWGYRRDEGQRFR